MKSNDRGRIYFFKTSSEKNVKVNTNPLKQYSLVHYKKLIPILIY